MCYSSAELRLRLPAQNVNMANSNLSCIHEQEENGSILPMLGIMASSVITSDISKEQSEPNFDEPSSSGISNQQTSDVKYLEKRRKNNLSAKKSRDARKVRENQLKVQVVCLENANQVLRTQMKRLEDTIATLIAKNDELVTENDKLKQK